MSLRLSDALRLVPRTMSMQLVATILVAMAALQAVNLVILHDERRGAAFAVMRSQTLGQAATLLHLLDSPTTDDHSDRLRQAAAFSNFCIAFRDTSVSIPEPDEADVVLTRELGRLVENSSYDDLQARIRTEDQTPSFCDVRPPSNHEVFAPPSVFWGDTHTLTFIATGQRADGTVTIVQAALPVMRGVPIQFLRDAAVAALVISLITVLMFRRVTRPMKALAAAAQRLGRGAPPERLKETGPHEIVLASRAFNDMQERLTRFVEHRTRMLAAISHDLRTPLTSLRLRAEFVEDPENREHICQLVDEIRAMADATLDFAASDAVRESSSVVELNALLTAISAQARERGEEVTFTPLDEPVDYVCRRKALTRAVSNLVSNAVRYGGGATVRLEPPSPESGPRILVEDDGPGIPDDLLEEAFQPFQTLDASRNKGQTGVGLGLSICRTIIRAHGGDVTLINRPTGGLRAAITLPAWR